MLKNFIDNLLKKDKKTILITIAVILFALFALRSCIKPRKGKLAGEIFGKKIYQAEFDFALAKTKVHSQFSYGTLYENIKHFLDLETQTWEQILLNQEAKKRNITVTNKEVINHIAATPAFHRGGKFNVPLYKMFIRQSLKTDTETFEGGIKDFLRLKKLFENVTNNIALSEEETYKEYSNKNEELKISYISIPLKKIINNISVPEEEMLSYYTAHKEDFRVPSSVKAEYIKLNYPDDAGVQKKTEIKFKAKAIYKEYQETKELASLSKKYGFPLKETEYFTRKNTSISTEWSYEILAEIFELKLGAIKEPIKLDDGYLIVRNKDKRNPYIPEFINISEKVKNIMLLDRMKKTSIEEANKILNTITQKTKDNLDIESFKKTSTELNLEIKETNLLPKEMIASILGATDDEWKKVASLNTSNTLSKVINTENGQYIIFVENFKPINPEDYQKNKKIFTEQLIKQKQEDTFNNFLKDLKSNAELKTYTFPDFHL